MKNINTVYMVVVVLMLTACSSQTPAPVVDGYSKIPTGGYEQNRQQSQAQRQEQRHNINPYQAPQKQPRIESYYVQKGDSLTQIAKHYNIASEEIRNVNNMRKGEVIYAGQILKIPLEKTSARAYKLTHRYSKLSEEPEIFGGELDTTSSKTNKKIPQPSPYESKNKSENYLQHKVSAGENLYRIGLKYKVSAIDLMSINDIDRPQELKAGSIIKIPTKQAIKSSPIMEKLVQKRITRNLRKRGLVWPAKGRILKSYGNKGNGVTHTGISIALPHGTEIIAAENGKVIYADNGLESYGNLILIRHKNGLVTAYAHNSKNFVKRNQKVKKGDIIALAGNSGNVEKSQLHFEVRKNARAINPLNVLPRM